MKTIISILDTAPLPIAVMAFALLIAWATDRKMRRTAASVLFLTPLLPIIAIRTLAVMTIWLCDRACAGRWAEPFARRAAWLNAQYGE